ncbi:MAG: alpha/beta hydrolase fold domain-containing protein [Phycisphaerae bacterium]|jgi:acetyl esterase/lipase|nr:alpha/beta hydrolase fold domain-containing protein [Phycisphaerae bacterium]
MARILTITAILTACLVCSTLTEAVDKPAQPDARFKKWDKNSDGKLSRDELPKGLQKNFDRVDTDKNGFISVKEHRAVTSRRRRPARTPQSKNVTTIRDIPYADNDNPRQKLDLFLPKAPKSDKPLPVVVFIHGGAWRAGSKNGGLRMVAPYVASGDYAGASIAYRLSQEAIWPAQIHDCKAAIRWLKANAKKHNLDPNRIAVWGTSAGGHLVAMLGVSGDVKQLEGKIGKNLKFDSRVACVVNWFGPTDMLTIGKYPSHLKHDAPDSPEAKLLGGAIHKNKPAARNASPVTHVSKGDAPTLTMHGTNDQTVPFNQGERIHEALTKAGVPSVFVKMIGAGHGGFKQPDTRERVKAFIEKYLRDKKVEVSDKPINCKR